MPTPTGRKVKRTNAAGTCLYCGRKLRRRYPEWVELGPYRDNAFCTLSCGYGFGKAAAHLGFRLAERAEE